MCRLLPHTRRGHMVRGHFRGRKWIPGHFRSGSFVNIHCLLQD